MKNILVILNHNLSNEQMRDLFKISGCKINFKYLSDELQLKWANISAEANEDYINDIANEFFNYIISQDVYTVIIQGESGITYRLITMLKIKDIICLYACTKRVSKDIKNADGVVEKKSEFQHVRFRKY